MPNQLIKPLRLTSGDTIAVISLSWGGAALYPERLRVGIHELKKQFGLHAIAYPSTLLSPEELRANPELRAKDMMDAFSDPSINGIICSIGGDDTIELLPYIDFDVIRNNPKIFLGYSDTTVNHLMCYRAGLSTMYGPSVMSGIAENGGMNDYSAAAIHHTLMTDKTVGLLRASKYWTNEYVSWDNSISRDRRRNTKPTGWRYLQGETTVQGQLLGGCVQSLMAIKDSELFPKLQAFEGAIVFLESSSDASGHESLRSLINDFAKRQILQSISGMIFGRPEDAQNETDFVAYEQLITQLLADYERQDMPIITRMDFGHTDPMFILPYGTRAEINPIKQSFLILESAVR